MKMFFLLLILVLPVFAQDKFPDTLAGKRAAAFLEMTNSDGDEPLKKFITENMAPNDEITIDQRVERFRNIRNDLKGAKLVKFLQASDSGIAFLIQTTRGETFRLGLIIEPGLESRIAGIGLESVDKDYSEKPPETIQKLSESALVPETEKFLAQLAKDDKFSGVVLIAENGRTVFSQAYGFAKKETKVPNTIDTKFNLGSINKVFTMLAIGILADQGRLTLDDKLGKHLPDYPNKDAREKVTIRHLLSMRGGISDFFGPEYEKTAKEKLRNINDFIPLFSTKPLKFEPGTKREYSNGGYILLGAIIEKASGKSYYEFVRERIFRPIRMYNTDAYFSDQKIPNIAMGYTFEIEPEKMMPNIQTRPARGSSAGGGYSTAGDLLKFANAIESGSFKVPIVLLYEQDPMIGGMFRGGIGAAGGAPGINAALDSKLAGKYTVIVLSNYDPPSAGSIARRIRQWLGER